MRSQSLVVLTLFAVAVAVAGDDASKKDRESLQGTWKLVAGRDDQGKPFPADLIEKGLRLVVTGDRLKFMPSGGDDEMAFQIVDPTKKPKHVDLFVVRNGKKNTRPVPGIYEIDGNRLRLSMNDRGGTGKGKDAKDKGGKPAEPARPTSFDEGGPSFVLERQK
jgi:uncharacterized protein (TIGR03067 family)